MYNMYVTDIKEDLLNFDFVIPEFFNKDKFRINKELIPNKLTKDYLDESEKLEYVFKTILNSFSSKRKKPIGVFNENTVILFNNYVDKIDMTIDNYLKKIREIELTQSGLVDFGTYFEIDYDGDRQVYPDIFDEIEKGITDNKKKKGEGKGEFPSKKKLGNI